MATDLNHQLLLPDVLGLPLPAAAWSLVRADRSRSKGGDSEGTGEYFRYGRKPWWVGYHRACSNGITR